MTDSPLEKRIATALGGNGKAAAADLEVLIQDVQASMATAEAEATQAREAALDLLTAPDAAEANQAAQLAALKRDRLAAALPRLQDRLRAALAQDYADKWSADYQRVEAQRDAAAERFRRYPELVAELVDILHEAEAVDREVARVDIAAPEGEHRRLLGVELTSRGLKDFSRSQPSIAKNISLPEWEASDRMAWPPPRPSIAAAYAASITPPFDPRYSADWWKVSEQAAAARQRERERAARHYEDMTVQQEQRVNREERERFETGQRRTTR